jgi:molybdopterin synthase catalytic subunit
MDRPPQSIRVDVGPEVIDTSSLLAEVADPGAGAIVVFLGTVRDHSEGREGVTHLDYEVYEEIVEAKIRDIVEEAMAKWPLVATAVRHRSGRVDLGEASVGIAVSAAHRGDAFDAAEYLIDELKLRAPIWKKEHWPGGSEWSRGS